MDALFDADEMGFGDDFSNVSGFGSFSDSSQGFIDHAGIDALMQAMSGIDGNPAQGGQMIGYSQIGDWNGDGIWDIQQDINSSPDALAQWLYGVALVEAGIDPFTGEAIASDLLNASLSDGEDEVIVTGEINLNEANENFCDTVNTLDGLLMAAGLLFALGGAAFTGGASIALYAAAVGSGLLGAFTWSAGTACSKAGVHS